MLSVPDSADRYYRMPLLSGWTDVFEVPGKRTTGTGAQTYLITGPGWKGTVPGGAVDLASPTNMVWILGRTYCTGTPEDYKKVKEEYGEAKEKALYERLQVQPNQAVVEACTWMTQVKTGDGGFS